MNRIHHNNRYNNEAESARKSFQMNINRLFEEDDNINQYISRNNETLSNQNNKYNNPKFHSIQK